MIKDIRVLLIIPFALITLSLISRGADDNPHGDINFDCELCHSPEGWTFKGKAIEFKHADTGFPLIGAHEETGCRECHESLVFSHTGTACIDCHVDVHAGEFGLDCSNCHVPVNWENRFPVWEEHNQTRFPLIGFHAPLDCESCHRDAPDRQYTNSVECNGCHEQDYISSRNPDHELAGFSTHCEECHSPVSVSWQQVQYTHPAVIILHGSHQGLECLSCHEERYAGTGNQCEDCHMDDFNSTTDPGHVQFGFPTTCDACHDEWQWENSTFDHLTESGFELIGAHARIRCTDCHENNQLTGLPRECFECHTDDYTSVDDPNHVSNNFSHDCLDCHSQEVWVPSTFDHNNTSFVLTGAHLTVDCISCHETGYSGTASDCYSCHEQDYISVQDPGHQANNFDHDCTICHSTSAWSPSTFNHSNTAFPLTGAHGTLMCSSCHQEGYANTPSDCYSCHQDDYDGTTDPNHQAANFPVTCESCHNTVAWDQTTWDHDNQYFPIYTGSHIQQWTTCADCHVSPSDYSLFECINCHAHNQADMDDKHSEEGEYQYLSTACYDCHSDGRVHEN